jgi:hypothetical protein
MDGAGGFSGIGGVSDCSRLFQITANYIDKFFRRFRLRWTWFVRGIHDMKPNVPFQDFRHQTIYGATAGDGKVQCFGAISFFLQELFKRVNLATKPTYA